MLQMLGRLMWIGVGAVAVKALEAGLKSNNFGTPSSHGSTASGNGNGHASSGTRTRRTSRRSTATKSTAH